MPLGLLHHKLARKLPIVFDLGTTRSLLEAFELSVLLLSDYPCKAGPLVDLVNLPLRGFCFDLKVRDILEEIWLNSVVERVALRADAKYEASFGLIPVSYPGGPAICIIQ